MAKNIQILKRSSIEVHDLSSYKLVLEAVNAEGMPDKIFVNQRIRNFAKGTVDDTFAAVCTPVQLEDFAEDAPAQGSSYYRTNTIEIVVRTPEMLNRAFDSIIYEVKKLVLDLENLDILTPPILYNVNPLLELTDVIGLTSKEISELNTTQLSILDEYVLPALSTLQLAGLSTTQIVALSRNQINSLTATQVASLRTEAITALDVLQITALNTSAVAALRPAQLTVLSTVQVNTLSTIQIAALKAPQVAALRTEAITALTTAQIVAFTAAAVAGMTTAEVAVLSRPQLAAMEPEDVAAIIPPAIHNLTTDQLTALTTAGLAAFTDFQVLALSSEQLGSLDVPQRDALPVPPTPPAPAVPTLWIAPNTLAGNVEEIVSLSDFAVSFVRANIGNAASWVIKPYSFVDQGTTHYDNAGIVFTINNVSPATSKMVLTVAYKNNAADPSRPGKAPDGSQHPYMYVRNLTGTIRGNMTIRWNGQTVVSASSGVMPGGVFDYYPDDLQNFGAAGKLTAGQSTALIVEIEATGAATEISGELFFGYWL